MSFSQSNILNSMSFSQSNIFLVKSVDPINHLLHKFDLTVSQPMLVGDIVGDTRLSSGFSASSTRLKVKLLASGSKNLGSQLGPAWEINVNRSSHSCAKVCRAGMDVTISFIQHKVMSRFLLDRILDSLDTSCQPVKHLLDVASLLHGDDPQLVFLVDPGQEGLVLVVEDSSALWPVPLHASNLEIWVSGHEEEVIINQLLPHLLTHSSERKVGTSKVTLEVGKGLLHQVLDVNSLLLGDSGRETESINVATDTDTGRVDGCLLADGAFDLAGIHVACVSGISCNTMVLLDQWVEHVREDLVRVPISSINATMLIIELNSTCDGFGEREPRGDSLGSVELLPDGFGDILGHQGVLGLDFWEGIRHLDILIKY